MRVPAHTDSETIYDHLEERLEEPEARAVEAHLWRCDACRRLRDECAAVVSGLGWYGAETPDPPTGYWSDFWARWETRDEAPSSKDRRARILPFPRIPELIRDLAPAAAIAALLVGWWAATLPDAADEPPAIAGPTPPQVEDASGAWQEDIEMFERATIMAGGVDPLSKGIVLVGLVEER